MADHPTGEISAEDERASQNSKFSWLTVELRTIIILSCAIFLDMTAYSSIESLQSSLNSKAGLGSLSLACIYGPNFLFAIAAPVIVRIITPKWCIVTSWICNVLYIIANFYPTWATLIPASALTGAMRGSLWTAKDLYVSQVARRSVKEHKDFNRTYQSVLSFYNGIVYAGISSALVVGQIISSAILLQSSSPKSTSVCGAFSCQYNEFLDFNITNQTSPVSSSPEKSLVYTFIGVSLCLVLLAISVIIIFLPPIPSGNQNNSIKTTFLSCARRVSDSNMLLMIPQVVLIGFYQATAVADYTRSYITCSAGVGMVGYVMMCWGVTSTLASVICGRLVKYTGRQIQVVFALLGYIGVTIMLWVWIPSRDQLTLYFIFPAAFGLTDVVLQTHICTILALMFKDDSASAFANWYAFRSLSKAVSFVLSGIVCVWVKLAIASIVLVLASASFVSLELKLRSQNPLVKDGLAMEATLKPMVKTTANSEVNTE